MSEESRFWNLERRDGQLSWAGCSLSEVASDYGTPLYVVNPDLLRQAHDAIRRPFDAEGLEAKFYFSYKTNPVPAVLRRIAALGCGAEIISEFELWLATRLGLGGGDIVVNGTWKSPELLREAVQREVALVNVESLDELQRLAEVASRSGKRVNLGLRINPCLSKSRLDFTLSSGSRTSHSGFRRGKGEWTGALRLVRDTAAFDLKGLQFHIGSGVRSARPYMDALEAAMEMWTDLLEAGCHPTILDIGGGFAVPTLKEFNLFDAVRFFGWKRSPGVPRAAEAFDISAEVSRACATILRRHARERGIRPPTLYLEPGRALVATSQLLLLRVLSIRTRPAGPPVAICDAGAMSVSPALLSEKHAVVPVNTSGSRRSIRYDIVGNLPAPLDLVALGQNLPRLEPGDVIAIMDVGAYFTALGNNFAGARVPIVFVENGCATLIRERETFPQMIARDVDMREDRGPD